MSVVGYVALAVAIISAIVIVVSLYHIWKEKHNAEQ